MSEYNKQNLYYIVDKGTNRRVTSRDNNPLIGTNDGIKNVFNRTYNQNDLYEIISIEEYEKRYVIPLKEKIKEEIKEENK